MTKIAVLGCGPAGLIAAETARQYGAEVRVFSRDAEPSYIAGAQYLHVPIPGITSDIPDGMIRVHKRGTQEGYAMKVYGDPSAPVSWDRYEERDYPAWNMRRAYAQLWRRWEQTIVPITLTPELVREIIADAIISTIPKRALCERQGPLSFPQHGFIDQAVHIRQVDPPAGAPIMAYHQIVYNGEESPSWYRSSHIFGSEAMEWSAMGGKKKPPLEGIVTIHKPLANNCDCWDNTDRPMVLAGRYGTWSKDGLVHDVVDTVTELLDEGL